MNIRQELTARLYEIRADAEVVPRDVATHQKELPQEKVFIKSKKICGLMY